MSLLATAGRKNELLSPGDVQAEPRKTHNGAVMGASGTGLAQVSPPGLSSCEHNTQGWHGPGILVFSTVKRWALLSATGAKPPGRMESLRSCHTTDTPQWNQKAFVRKRLLPQKHGASHLLRRGGRLDKLQSSFLGRERDSLPAKRETVRMWHSLAIFWHKIWECCARRELVTDDWRWRGKRTVGCESSRAGPNPGSAMWPWQATLPFSMISSMKWG